MSFWQSFQGLLGPHGFKGFKAEDMFDDERWKFKATPEWENPNVMGAALGRPAGTYNYQPRGLKRGGPRPGASIASTKQPSRRPPLRPIQVGRRLDPRQQVMQDLARDRVGITRPLPNAPTVEGVPIPTPAQMRGRLGRVVEETGRYWNPKLENLARTTGDYWGPKVDRVMDETAQFGRGVADDTFGFWDPMVRRDLGKLEETWNRADLVGDTKKYWTPKVEQVWSDTIRAYQPKWEDLLKYLRRDD